MATAAFTGSIDGTFAPGVGVVTPTTDSPTQTEPVVMTLEAHARLTLPAPQIITPPILRHAAPGTVLTMPTPAIVNGMPRTPKLWAAIGVSGSAQAGVGHLRSLADPDPVWTGSSYSVGPPPISAAGAHFSRWTAKTLPNPSTFPGLAYLLGTRSSSDGTTGLPSAAGAWEAAPGSDWLVHWFSSYPFKPTVSNHVHYGSDGSVHTETVGVHFTPHKVAQMWCDFGTLLTPPFTMLVVAVILDFHSPSHLNTIFDAGEDPGSDLSTAQRDAIHANGLAGDIRLTEAFGYRNALRAGRTQLQMFTDPTPSTRIARLPFHHTTKPKVMAMVVNGSHSMLYVRDKSKRYVKNQAMAAHGAQRLWVLGRPTGLLSPRYGASMVVFEIRAWDKALSATDLDKQYGQLSSTWKFGAYK